MIGILASIGCGPLISAREAAIDGENEISVDKVYM